MGNVPPPSLLSSLSLMSWNTFLAPLSFSSHASPQNRNFTFQLLCDNKQIGKLYCVRCYGFIVLWYGCALTLDLRNLSQSSWLQKFPAQKQNPLGTLGVQFALPQQEAGLLAILDCCSAVWIENYGREEGSRRWILWQPLQLLSEASAYSFACILGMERTPPPALLPSLICINIFLQTHVVKIYGEMSHWVLLVSFLEQFLSDDNPCGAQEWLWKSLEVHGEGMLYFGLSWSLYKKFRRLFLCLLREILICSVFSGPPHMGPGMHSQAGASHRH